MSFIARVEVTKCEHCPYIKERLENSIIVLFCGDILTHPIIEYNGILNNCPHNKKDKFLPSISDYVKDRQEK